VDGAIHRAGGPASCASWMRFARREARVQRGARCHYGGSCPRDTCFMRRAIYKDGKHRERSCWPRATKTCLNLAEEREARTISFPSISTGVYGFRWGRRRPSRCAR